MKRKNRIIIIFAIVAILTALFAFSASAEDSAEVTPSASVSSEAVEDNAQNEEKNFFDEAYTVLTENADKIFAALAFIGTLVVSFAYKKGLIPLLSGAMTALKGNVESIKENGNELTKNTHAALEILCKNTQCALDDAAKTRDEIKEINDRLSRFDRITEQHEELRLVLSSQIDMLYAIFMSSALPQYQKEEVGTRINKMKEALEKYEQN